MGCGRRVWFGLRTSLVGLGWVGLVSVGWERQTRQEGLDLASFWAWVLGLIPWCWGGPGRIGLGWDHRYCAVESWFFVELVCVDMG